jgi:Rho-binding antiterminator
MHRYPIKLILKSGVEIEGVGVDTKRNDARDECIEMHIDGEIELIVLDSILTLKVQVDNPHFKHFTFD